MITFIIMENPQDDNIHRYDFLMPPQ